ncbi:MAG: hypothetical protein E6L00_02900 [Thaumarchaeota archaeon]|nr:MAG: hypothetical protein E6L02_03040 [Nitrososphaerota archaeon]TLX82695.1 MAG: hypothetical protein E6L00_02900 [Nitrososphaerota archaeon]
MSEPNYAGNIIVSLASLPEFLRKPILKKRLMEFFSMSPSDKIEIINNALQAGSTIPFDKFSKLFKTWLEILSTLSEDQRTIMFTTYIAEITENPQKIILFNLDGILEVYLSLNQGERDIISKSVKKIINSLDDNKKKRLLLVIPDRARIELGI